MKFFNFIFEHSTTISSVFGIPEDNITNLNTFQELYEVLEDYMEEGDKGPKATIIDLINLLSTSNKND